MPPSKAPPLRKQNQTSIGVEVSFHPLYALIQRSSCSPLHSHASVRPPIFVSLFGGRGGAGFALICGLWDKTYLLPSLQEDARAHTSIQEVRFSPGEGLVRRAIPGLSLPGGGGRWFWAGTLPAGVSCSGPYYLLQVVAFYARQTSSSTLLSSVGQSRFLRTKTGGYQVSIGEAIGSLKGGRVKNVFI